jgi:FecR protein
MNVPWMKALNSFLLAAVLAIPAWAVNAAYPGTLNYIEGQSAVGEQSLNVNSVGSVNLEPGRSLSTGNGKAEILLTPGVFLRVGNNSTVKMVSSNLTDTQADLLKGQAIVEVAEIHKYNRLLIGEQGVTTAMLKDGLYAFDADHDSVRVLKGEARV